MKAYNAGKNRKIVAIALVSVLTAALGLSSCTKPNGPEGASAEAPSASSVRMDMYVMSKCPFGVQAENALRPALEKFGSRVDFHLNFIGTTNEDGSFSSLHGEAEVKGNMIQLCAMKKYPDRYWDLVICMNKTARDIPNNWESCATESGLDAEALRTCFEGDEGKDLLRASFAESKTKGARGSPTIHINNEPYTGNRSETSFLRSLCGKFSSDPPQLCQEIPPPTQVQLTLLNDKRCKNCSAGNVVSQLKTIFPGLVTKTVDYGDPEGKKLYEESKIKFLPAALFDESVEGAEAYSRVQRYLAPAGKYRSLAIGSKFDPTAEICDNNLDDTGNGKMDCDDPTCENSMVCREEIAKKLDIFVMSQCPYGVRALNAMKDILPAFEKDIDFSVHYIASEAGEEFRSLHGQPEVDEDIRQLCAIEHYREDYKFMDYIWCRNENVRSADWKTCTGSNGISAEVLEKCAAGEEGKKLLRDDIKIAQALEVGGSPTWLANNRYKFSGLAADAIKKNFCTRNPEIEGCS